MMYGIIGGSGVYDPSMIEGATRRTVQTPFGDVTVTTGRLGASSVAFIPRHGANHGVPPHLVNYRANIWALKQIGVTRVISTSAVGSLKHSITPGSYVVLSNFLDFTKRRPTTYYEGAESVIGDQDVVHIDVTEPYCPQLRDVLYDAGRELDLPMISKGVYVCTEGPRFETSSEIGMFSILGGDVVGMTNVPEVVLARELEMCYASVAMVTNYAAGISSTKLTHAEVMEIMSQNIASIKELIRAVIPMIPEERTCPCPTLLQGAKG
jgi:5'-methylthioadenosine phosphorylase